MAKLHELYGVDGAEHPQFHITQALADLLFLDDVEELVECAEIAVEIHAHLMRVAEERRVAEAANESAQSDWPQSWRILLAEDKAKRHEINESADAQPMDLPMTSTTTQPPALDAIHERTKAAARFAAAGVVIHGDLNVDLTAAVKRAEDGNGYWVQCWVRVNPNFNESEGL